MNFKELLEKYRELERRLDEKLTELEEENRRLKEELERARKGGGVPEKELEEMRAYYEALLKGERDAKERERQLRFRVEEKLKEVMKELEGWRALRETLVQVLEKAPQPAVQLAAGVNPAEDIRTPVEDIVANLPKYDRSIYEYLARHSGVPFTAYQIAMALGKSPKSSAFRMALSRLQKLGLIERQGKNQYVVRR